MTMRVSAICCLVGVFSIGQAHASTLTWTGGAGDRAFENPQNWEDAQGENRAPGADDTLELREPARQFNAPIFTETSGDAAYEQILIGGEPITINAVETQPELWVEGGVLRVNEMILADRATERARVIQDGGSVLTRELRLSSSILSPVAPAGSTYQLDDGYLSSALTVVGQSGDATFLQRGGEFEVSGLRVGNAAFQSGGQVIVTGTGTYEMRDGILRSDSLGTPLGDQDFFRNTFGTAIGNGGRGVFDQSGGLHQAQGGALFNLQLPLVVGGRAFGSVGSVDPDYSGTYILRGDAELQSAYDMVLGQGAASSSFLVAGYGIFRHQDGIATIDRDVILGEYSATGSGAGFYLQSGGELGIARDLIIGQSGADGTGAGLMEMISGEARVGGDVVINAYAPGAEDQSFIDPVTFTMVRRNELRLIGVDSLPRPEIHAGRLIIGGEGDAEAPTARLSLNGGASVYASVEVRAGGELTGDGGIINGKTQIARDGLLNPGLSPGELTIDGDLSLLDGSLTRLEIGGLSWGEYDFLTVTGDLFAEDGARVELSFIDGFAPTAPFDLSLFDVGGDASSFDTKIAEGLLAFSVTGLPSPQDFSFTLSSLGLIVETAPVTPPITQPGDGRPVSAHPIPLPAAGWLLIGGLGALAGLHRRRKAG